MIKSIKFVRDAHPFTAGTLIQFHPGVNLICGDQGTGKSSLLEAIMLHDREFAQHVILDQDGTYKAFAYFSSEHHNPRTIDGGLSIGETKYSATLDMFYEILRDKLATSRLTNAQHFQTMLVNAYANCKNTSNNVIDKKLIDLDVISRSAMQSHGQALFPFLQEALNVQGGIVFLDEPETSLSIKSQMKLVEMLATAGKSNQIFVATHSEILIRYAPKVLSLSDEAPVWVKSASYINKQYQTIQWNPQ